jgi:hypothetical protein
MTHHHLVPVDVLLFHDPPSDADPPLTRLLAEVRGRLAEQQAGLFRRAGAGRVIVTPGRGSSQDATQPFGWHLRELIREHHITSVVVLGSGAVPRLAGRDARTLIQAAGSDGRRAITNNRYSSDIVAVSDASVLRELPALPSDNALPRWLEEHAGFDVTDLAARDRLALDLDSPLDVALWALAPDAPAWARHLAHDRGLEIPNADALRDLARDPRRELLVFGRSGSRQLRWLERNVRCRVRFLAEERGLRASSPLAIGGGGDSPQGDSRPGSSRPVAQSAMTARPPSATLGRLLAARGPEAFATTIAELADGAIVDTRVLMADRLGADETAWPAPEDRFASDLLHADAVADPWLAAITRSAATAGTPIALGAHTLVGPGIPLLLQGSGNRRMPRGPRSLG